MPWTIYKLHLRGFPSHKGYVGVTDNWPRRRGEYESSITDTTKVRLIHRMLKRHGILAFEFLILEEGIETESHAYRKEKQYIKLHRTLAKYGGWNVAEGGKDAPDWVKRRKAQAAKAKLAGTYAWIEYSALMAQKQKP
jgi:hypothetical protein